MGVPDVFCVSPTQNSPPSSLGDEISMFLDWFWRYGLLHFAISIGFRDTDATIPASLVLSNITLCTAAPTSSAVSTYFYHRSSTHEEFVREKMSCA